MLYKYVSNESMSFSSVLKDDQVYFSSPLQLNDPFELNKNVRMPSKQELKLWLKEQGVKRKDLKWCLEKNIEVLSSELTNVDSINKALLESSGIFCMTPSCDNLLMWAHYANSHKGVCFGFDIEEDHDECFGYSYNVEYRNSHPSISILEFLNLEIMIRNFDFEKASDFDGLIEKLLFVKSTHWEYEKEVRMVRDPLRGSGLHTFTRSKLKEIIIGSRADEQTIKAVKEYKEKKNPTVKVIEAKPDKVGYMLNFRELNG